MFFVPMHRDSAENPGLTLRKIRKMGTRAVDANEVFFDNYVIPSSCLIGSEGQGFKMILHGMNAERCLLAGEALGLGYVEASTLTSSNTLIIEADTGARSAGRWLALAGPRITTLGHSTLLMQSGSTMVLVDPIITLKMGSPKSALEIFRSRPDAICCSHSHWDHCNPETLIRFDKRRIKMLRSRRCRPSSR